MLAVPRSVVLAAWAGALTTDGAPVADAVRAVTGTDEPHALSGSAAGGITDLTELLTALAATPLAAVRVVLPVPGDPAGLTGPATLNAEAIDAGEAVLVTGLHEPLGLVPEVTAFGSAWEPGAMVTWQAHLAALGQRPVTLAAASLPEAHRALRGALTEATRVLAALDVARWREDAADRIADVRDGALPRSTFPPSAAADVLAVASSAARVRAIVALASEDDGAAVTGFEAAERSRSLREVDAVARHALAAAANATATARR